MSRPAIKTSIDVTKINKEALITGKKGKYLSLAFWNSPKEFDDGRKVDGYVSQDIPRDMRESGVNGAILGNWEYSDKPSEPSKPAAPKSAATELGDRDCPF